MKAVRTFWAPLLVLVAIAGGFFGVSRAQDIIDWWKLRNYTAPAPIEQLAEEITLTDFGKRLFYVHKPDLQQKSTFQDSCAIGEVTIVLGCYITNQNIYIFDVEDERLAGVEQVTAAHEMLHAAYDRLSVDEKTAVDRMLNEAYERVTDARIQKNIMSYKARDESVVSNELHSILGTEVMTLPAELETYYKKYFLDRGKVVAFAQSYTDEFQKREAQIEVFDKQLEEMNGEIVRLQAELGDQSNDLAREKAAIDAVSEDPEAYNAKVPGFNAKVNTYNASVARLKDLIATYNDLVTKRNEIAVEERDLQNAIDTRAEAL